MVRHVYSDEVLREACEASTSVSAVLRYLNIPVAGGNHSHISRRIEKLDIDTSHFKVHRFQPGHTKTRRKSPEEVLAILPPGSPRSARGSLLKAMLSSGVEYRCRCGNQGDWQGTPLVLEIDHINGDWLDNRLQNLRFLCPNCHSQETVTSRPRKNLRSRAASRCECGRPKRAESRNCKHCYNDRQSGVARPERQKIEWPPSEELRERVSASSYSAVGRELGVSDNAVRKHLKKSRK